MYQAVIFDMDGVIIDSEPIHFRMMSGYAEELGIRITEEEWNVYTGMANREIFTSLKEKHGLQKTAEEMTTAYMKGYMDFIMSSADIEPIRGVDVLIKHIHEAGFPLALASSASLENITGVLRKFRLEKYFRVTVSGTEMARSKPAPDVYLCAAELLKTDPAQCIVIEDSTNGLKAAKAAGMKAIAYKNLSSGEQDLSLGDIVIDDFEGIDFMKLIGRI